ncbi:MAG TPA: response regulator [Pseudonocardiaceae bacterium]|jgi:two-component system KDP operon response regulator KdpE|nr:response regulator [Pseudonocardiaceae bacterium]
MNRILVVDDESQLLRALRINLRARAYEVETAQDGSAALAAVARRPPDVVVLDLGLPGISGIEVITGLRGWTRVPIIVLSGRADPAAKVEALDAGADDYVTKPFNMDELLARIRAALRHQSADAPQRIILLGDHTVDLGAHRITRRCPAQATGGGEVGPDVGADPGGEPAVHLTPTEWKILTVLLHHPGALVESHRLLTEVWGPHYRTETDHLRFHIAQLRRKLEPDPAHPRHLLTEVGLGYRYQP